MTPERFVAALKSDVREGAKNEVKFFGRPPSQNPPDHLARFSKWYRSLSSSDRKVARDVIRYTAEGSLFSLLTYLDNIEALTDEGGTFELWHIGQSGKRTRLNDPEGELLNELFNNLPLIGSCQRHGQHLKDPVQGGRGYLVRPVCKSRPQAYLQVLRV